MEMDMKLRAMEEEDLNSKWHDLDWAMGQCFMVGWEGTEVTNHIRTLIEDQHIGAVLLTIKNLKTAEQTARLIQELQTIAHQSGHPVPLLIALDQENGGTNSLFDADCISQFPSAMGIAATGSTNLAYEVCNATACELSAIGINMIMGPVLDALTNVIDQRMGVRTTGDDPQEVSQYGIAAMNGYKKAGISTCGKHFPSYGSLDFLGSSSDMPVITESLEQLRLGALVPFRDAIREGLDAIMVGGCAITNEGINVMHACLSDKIVDDLLRTDLGFSGVAISECLEMDALRHNIGIKGGTVMATKAGCDLILICRSFSVQLEAVSGLRLGVESNTISRSRINVSLKRILDLKRKCTSWQKALYPAGVSLLSTLRPSHLALSIRAYDNSITVVRDVNRILPLSNTPHEDEELLLLTPLLRPLPASAESASTIEVEALKLPQGNKCNSSSSLMTGEMVFRDFGRLLARQRHGKVIHTSYTAHGLRPVHEDLINKAGHIIIVTADSNRNLYQSGFTKHVAMICSMFNANMEKTKKSLIVVAVSSPYDFAMDKSIGTYICTFDFTSTAMNSLVRVLFGELVSKGTLPGSFRKSRKVKRRRGHWLVETWRFERDNKPLQNLIQTVVEDLPASQQPGLIAALPASFSFPFADYGVEETHYIVRNSSTQTLFGFCSTYYFSAPATGILGVIFVHPSKRNLSIGRSLHQRALRGLLQKPHIQKLQLGSSLTSIFPGIPVGDPSQGEQLKRWFATNGWDASSPMAIHKLIIKNLSGWVFPVESIQDESLGFDLSSGVEDVTSVLEHVSLYAKPDVELLYRLALSDSKSFRIITAKSSMDGALVGTVIVCWPSSIAEAYIPVLFGNREGLGSILAPIVPRGLQSSAVLQGLALHGIRHNVIHNCSACVLNWVSDDERDVLQSVGFDVLETWEEMTSLPENVSLFASAASE